MASIALSNLSDLAAAVQKAYDTVGSTGLSDAQNGQLMALGDRLKADWQKLAGQYIDDQTAEYANVKAQTDSVTAELKRVLSQQQSNLQTLQNLGALVKAVDSLLKLALPFS